MIREFYPAIKPFTSPKLGVYWRGPVELLDGSHIEIVLLEDTSGPAAKYTMNMRQPLAALESVAAELAETEFPSARAALIATERACNRAIFKRILSPDAKSHQ